ncbi:MAG: alkaline phosphatase family protein [Candidatus Eremiobacteraeota bacterium]|nr:alkaline phosphatase family protein [Candidatus Eremiobacteraeota bacterium]
MDFGYIDPGTGMTLVGTGTGILLFILGLFGAAGLFFKKIFKFFWDHRKLFLIILILILAIAIAAGVYMNQPAANFNKKVIILGFDGLSPDLVEPMMAKGELPNLKKLSETGSYRRLSTTNPSQSPVAWTGFSTGRNPGKNGLFDFIVRDPANYGLSLSLSKMDKGRFIRVVDGKCFWNYTTEKRIPATVLHCPVTFPPDRIMGRMLSGMGVPDILGTEGTLTLYTSEKVEKDEVSVGNFFHVAKAPVMVMNLIGPKVASARGKSDNVKVPIKVTVPPQGDKVTIEYQNNSFDLEKDRWSDFKDVTFKIGTFRKAKGIVKFYLLGANPDFKLYISPINFDPRDPLFDISAPRNYSKEVSSKTGLFYTMGMPMDTWALNQNILPEDPFLAQIDEVQREKMALLSLELKRFTKGILYSYFETADMTSHMFWRYIDSSHPLFERDAPPRYRDAIKDSYKKLDAVLGEVLAQMGGEDILIVLSDHGFNSFRRMVHVNTWLRKNGYLELRDPKAPSGVELLKDIDWSKTRVYAAGFGALYLNLKGRERDGIVTPGEEAESLKKELKEKMKNWRDGQYLQPVIHNVYTREEIFWGNKAEQTPDLFIGFNTGYRASWQTALGGVPPALLEDNLQKWSGDHLFDPALIPGVLFSNRKITREKPSIMDVTPTLLRICGMSDEELKKCDLDGTPLF